MFYGGGQKDSCKAAQGKCSFPWDGIGLAHKRQLRFHRAVCKTAISPERCIIAPFILKGFGRCCVREHHAPSLQEPVRLPADGMRFSEALAITPADFDFARQTLSISKTWDYKGNGGFLPTKNKSSVRKIQIDWQIVVKFSELTKNLPEDQPIFVGDSKIYNSTVNDVLTRHCKACGISEISIHGLRHTHASLLLFAGVSIASVARRLGHASMTTTQKTYLHIIQELENKDVDLVMRTLSGL